MSAIIIVLLFVCAQGMKIASPEEFQKDYIIPSRTNCIKGFFVLMVFISHFRSYVTLTPADNIAVTIVAYLGQLMVAPFLFYSGYGVMESIKRKGLSYVKSIPVHRALKTLLHFDIAVLLFLIVRSALGVKYSLQHILLAFTTWTSLGNSNWYILVIISSYLISAVSSFVFKRNHYLAAVSVTLLSILLSHTLSLYQPDYWYNTILCYSLGVWYSILREKMEKIVMQNDILYCAAMAFAFMAYHWLSGRTGKSTWIYQIYALFFVILVVGVAMKISYCNAFLDFLGSHIFSIYILQRIPMMILNWKGIYKNDNASFFLLSFVLTCILALAYDFCMNKLDGLIFAKPQKCL